MLLNWKTTAAGALAVLTAAIAIGNNLISGHIDPNLIFSQLGLIAAGVVGLFAKDKNVTGAGSTGVAH